MAVKLHNRRALAGALFGVAALGFLFWHQPPIDLSRNVYSTRGVPPRFREGIQFFDRATEMGMTFRHQVLRRLGSVNVDGDETTSLGSPFPSVSVVDVNADGFMDVFVPGDSNRLFINQGGQQFVEMAKQYGVEAPGDSGMNSFGLFADFNGDGKLDLFLARWPCHMFFYGAGPGKPFVDRSDLMSGYCSNPEAVGVLDFNKDGRLDLVFANLLSKKDELPASFPYWFSAPRYDSETGAVSDMLLQQPNGKFLWKKDIGFFKRPYSHALGVSDFNDDGWPDIFIANDYSFDQVYLNMQGRRVAERTRANLPFVSHGLTGMGAEFADVNMDGKQDLYVSNAYKPPFMRSYNVLWLRNENGIGFRDDSIETGVERCGFAWGAKFADFNNDGLLDLAVANGRERGKDVKSEGEGRSFWYERTVISQIPYFVREFYSAKRAGKKALNSLYTSAFERDCLFIQDTDSTFYDVADEAGMGEDRQEGRGLALIDFNNDGKMDFLVTNFRGNLKLWSNESVSRGDWIGFSLSGRGGNVIPHGSILRLVREGAPDLVREYYPANGYRAQSDPRVHFGLGDQNKLKYLEVRWPDGKVVRYDRLELNKYQTIVQ
jgi:hypothetical protein